MKKLKFTEYKKPDSTSIFTRDKFYRVFVKRGITIGFKSEPRMKSWLIESSKFYTFKMFQFVQVYSNVQKLYWDNWLYFSTNHTRADKNRFLAGQELDQNFALISKSLNRLELEARKPYGFNYVVIRMDNLKLNVDEICNLMIAEIPNGNTSVIYRLKSHLSELQLWQNQMDRFGLMDTAKIEDSELAEPIPLLKKVI